MTALNCIGYIINQNINIVYGLILFHIKSYYITLYKKNIILNYIMVYYIKLYYIILYGIILYYITLYYTVLHCIILYYIILYILYIQVLSNFVWWIESSMNFHPFFGQKIQMDQQWIDGWLNYKSCLERRQSHHQLPFRTPKQGFSKPKLINDNSRLNVHHFTCLSDHSEHGCVSKCRKRTNGCSMFSWGNWWRTSGFYPACACCPGMGRPKYVG